MTQTDQAGQRLSYNGVISLIGVGSYVPVMRPGIVLRCGPNRIVNVESKLWNRVHPVIVICINRGGAGTCARVYVGKPRGVRLSFHFTRRPGWIELKSPGRLEIVQTGQTFTQLHTRTTNQ